MKKPDQSSECKPICDEAIQINMVGNEKFIVNIFKFFSYYYFSFTISINLKLAYCSSDICLQSINLIHIVSFLFFFFFFCLLKQKKINKTFNLYKVAILLIFFFSSKIQNSIKNSNSNEISIETSNLNDMSQLIAKVIYVNRKISKPKIGSRNLVLNTTIQ